MLNYVYWKPRLYVCLNRLTGLALVINRTQLIILIRFICTVWLIVTNKDVGYTSTTPTSKLVRFTTTWVYNHRLENEKCVKKTNKGDNSRHPTFVYRVCGHSEAHCIEDRVKQQKGQMKPRTDFLLLYIEFQIIFVYAQLNTQRHHTNFYSRAPYMSVIFHF